MTYRECLDYFNELSLHKNIDGLQDDTYFQFDVIGRDSGHFYIHLKDDTSVYRYSILPGESNKWSDGSDLCICNRKIEYYRRCVVR